MAREVDDYFQSELIEVNVATVIFRGRGLLHLVTIYGNGAAGTAIMYAGVNAAGVMKGHFGCEDAHSQLTPYIEPVLFEHGLYIVPNAATTFVSVQWSPMPNKLGD